MLRMGNLVFSLLTAGRDVGSSLLSRGRNRLQLVFPGRFCQVFDRLGSYSLYKSFLLCLLKCTCFSRRASILYHPCLNKAKSAITIWGWNSLTAPYNRMLRVGVGRHLQLRVGHASRLTNGKSAIIYTGDQKDRTRKQYQNKICCVQELSSLKDFWSALRMAKPFHCLKPMVTSQSLSCQADSRCVGKRLLTQFNFTCNFWTLIPSFPFMSLYKILFPCMFFENELKALSYFI